MRIIAGKLGGRQFDSPSGHRTHPMSDKVRGALFNRLGDIEGLTMLDAFAGSGACSFEALSRGAKHVTAIEIAKRSQQTIENNTRTLGLEAQLKLIRANCSAWSDNNPSQQFDLALAAPPYDDLQLKLLQKLTRHVVPAGLFILDWPGNLTAPEFMGFRQVSQRSYGDAQLVFYRRST